MRKILLLLIVLFIIETVNAANITSDFMVLQWNYSSKEVISGLAVGDIDNNGYDEVVFSSSKEGVVYALDNNGVMKWKADIHTYVSDVYLGDINSDGNLEIVVNAGTHFQVLSSTGETLWKYSFRPGTIDEVLDVYIDDLDGDGKSELLLGACAKSRCDKGYLYVINASGGLITSYTTADVCPNKISSADLDGDGRKDIVLGTVNRGIRTYQGCDVKFGNPASVIALKLDDKELRPLWEYPTSGGVRGLLITDVNGDKHGDVLVASQPNFYLLGNDGNLEWDYPAVSYVESIHASDLDFDNKTEVLLGSDSMYVFDRNGRLRWTGITNSRVYSVFVTDLDNDGRLEVIAGSDRIYIYNATGGLLWTSKGFVSINSIEVSDLDHDQYPEIIVSSVKHVYVFKTGAYGKRIYATNYYLKAENFYKSNYLADALKYANMSKQLYSELGDLQGVSRCINLVSNISIQMAGHETLLKDAKTNYNLSREAFIAKDFVNALRYAIAAREKYLLLNDTYYTSKCDETINSSWMGIKFAADELYKNATDRYNNRDYKNALKDAEKSREYYTLINHSEGVANVENLISRISDRISEKTPGILSRIKISGETYKTAGIAAVVVMLAAVIFVVARKASKKFRRPSFGKGLRAEEKEMIRKYRESKKTEEESWGSLRRTPPKTKVQVVAEDPHKMEYLSRYKKPVRVRKISKHHHKRIGVTIKLKKV